MSRPRHLKPLPSLAIKDVRRKAQIRKMREERGSYRITKERP